MATLRERWPDLFNTPVPLAVGVRPQIRDALPEISCAQFRLVLRDWMQSTAYLQAVGAGVEQRNLEDVGKR